MEGPQERLAPHLLGLINPGLVIAGNLIGGPAGAMGALWMLGVGPVLDVVLGERRSDTRPAASGRGFHALLVVHALLHLAGIVTLLMLAATGTAGPWLWAAVLSTGVGAGVGGVIVAHELGHMRPRSPSWWLARLNMISVLYGHFTEEHNVTHHKHVATDKDPASAREGESVWGFVARTVPRQFVDAWRLHARRQRAWFRNPVLLALVVQGALIAAAFFWSNAAGWAFLGQAGVAIFLLEYINYVQHYGLRRADGERQSMMHSWQSERRWSCWTLLNLSLHPSHHLKASLGYWEATAHEGAPRMPSGYYGCFWPALVPPVWKRMLRSRIRALDA